MRRFWRNLVTLVVVAAAVLAACAIYADVGRMGDRLGDISPLAIVAALGLAALNYALRFVRWELYLARAGVSVPRGLSALVFVSGFALSVTPGKLGELFKSALLWETARAPAARTAPLVVAERVTDLVALVVLGLVGVAVYGVAVGMVLAGAAAVALGLLVVSWRPLAHAAIRALGRLPRAARFEPRLRELHDRLAGLLRPGPLSWATGIATIAWLGECVGFAVIAGSLPGAEVPLGLAIVIYAATTIAGALSFLPGGLVVTEASMVLLLVHSARGLDEPAAVAATIVTRLCTLWFAVALGVAAFVLLRRLHPSGVASAVGAPGGATEAGPPGRDNTG